MSKITNIIFNGATHKVSSKYGPRDTISTAAGSSGKFHRGTDYSTSLKKLPQYAIESGNILSCGTADDGAIFVWIEYPRLNVKMLHYHLDSLKVKKGQKVEKGTLIGYTGKTGKATGIHLHLGIYDLKKETYVDPEIYAQTYEELNTIFIGSERDLTKDQVLINANQLRIRKEPNTTSEVMGFVENKKYYEIFGNKEGWYLIEKGWISGQYCQLYNKKDDDIEKIQELKQGIAERDKEIERLTTDNTSLKGILNELQEQIEQDKVKIYKEIIISKKALYLITLQKGKLVIYRD